MAKRNVKMPMTPIKRAILWIIERMAIPAVGRSQCTLKSTLNHAVFSQRRVQFR
jgi:hypothetical protein